MSGNGRLYRTTDIYFSAYLMSLDVPLQASEEGRGNGNGGDKRKLTFVFTLSKDEEKKLKAKYFGGQGTIKARRFVDNLRSLKQMCNT